MLNERLAIHYGIEGVRGDPLRRVALQPEHHRGGLLTHASILGLTSDGTRHRPVHRGVWILESIIGKPPPPPPANVPALDTPAADQQKTSVREKLELHRSDPNCTACHNKIDPLGIAFDNYDAIGRWRTVETLKDGTGADPTLDPSGRLPDGRVFKDGQELRRLLVADIDKFAAAFSEKLATYALRRGMTFVDRESLKQVVEQAERQEYRLVVVHRRAGHLPLVFQTLTPFCQPWPISVLNVGFSTAVTSCAESARRWRCRCSTP